MILGSHRTLLKLLLAVVTAVALFIITALPAAALTVTFVRHGESEANASHTIDNSIPGAHLTQLGHTQAAAVAAALAANGIDYDAVYTSNMVRTAETAAPFAAEAELTPVVLPGVREINAGWFEGWSDAGLGGIGYVLAPALWTLGARLIPVPGGGDGNAFDARMDTALKIIEDSGAQNPVVFSHAATIMFWTMMNVDNPDLGLMLRHRLDNTEIVVVEGSAEEGWTLTNWAGRPVGPASLGTKLFVNVRDLVVAPQTAAFDVVQAFGTGDIRAIATAIRDGIGDVLTAPVKFVTTVVRDVIDAVSDAVQPDAAERVPNIAAADSDSDTGADVAAAVPEQVPAQTRNARTGRTADKPALTVVDDEVVDEVTEEDDEIETILDTVDLVDDEQDVTDEVDSYQDDDSVEDTVAEDTTSEGTAAEDDSEPAAA